MKCIRSNLGLVKESEDKYDTGPFINQSNVTFKLSRGDLRPKE